MSRARIVVPELEEKVVTGNLTIGQNNYMSFY